MLAQRYQKKMLKCNKNNYKSTKRLIIIKSTDISTSFISVCNQLVGQAKYLSI